MKRYALAVLLMLASPLAALAAPPSDAQVDRLLEVMRARQTVEAMLPQIEASQQQMVAQMMAGRELSASERKGLESTIARSSAQLRKTLAWPKLEPIYRDIYRQTFSGEDMDALIAFYTSPAGQNLLDKMPSLMQNTMNAMQKLIVPMMQDLQRDIEAEAHEGRVKDKSAGAETK
ncbi:DUF2059 domain-containing protein [Lysobacter silvisoli]|uniref:DUF2059 domain-containing protein n=1 Tax=Lysobacter silvisoli TaxID=2293254 RepID=A0A371JYU7_9GAMM|nr:DUF2059 domain-containing protein [Lysobacter silvisoli]RDZ26770.1 DUF2059 domain-containing protein [Lysobacter silvisoli]